MSNATGLYRYLVASAGIEVGAEKELPVEVGSAFVTDGTVEQVTDNVRFNVESMLSRVNRDIFDQQIDESTPGTTYIGFAELGTATSASTWLIRRITETPGSTQIQYTTGAFDSRASLVYTA